MTRTLFVFALLSTAGFAAAQQPQRPAQNDGAVAPAGETADIQSTVDAPAPEANTDVAADAGDAESLAADYKVTVKSFRTCRQKALAQGGVTAVSSLCASQRKRMLAARESLQGK